MECELFCGVCREVYEAGEKEPVVLPSCGHAFCRSCLVKLEEDGDKLGSYLSCPTCRTRHESPSVHALPPVFALLHLSENYKKPVQAGGGSKCTVHGSVLEFWCCECRTTLCGHCLLEGHVKEGHDVQAVQTFIEGQRRDVRTTGARLVWELNQRRRALQTEVAGLVAQLVRAAHQSQVIYDLNTRVAKVLEETDTAATVDGMLVTATLMKSLEHEVNNMASKEAVPIRTRLMRCRSCGEAPRSTPVAVIPRQESISESDWRVPVEEIIGYEGFESGISQAVASGGEAEAVEASTRQEEVEAEAGHNDAWTQELSGEESDGGMPEESPSPEMEWPVVCRVTAGGGRLGRLSWEGDRVHAYALTHEERSSHLLLQLAFLSFLGRDAQPEVFLDVATDEHVLGRVYIRLWGHLRRAQHFLGLCVGTHGPSYRGSKFHGVAKRGSMGETLAGGRYLADDMGNSVLGQGEGLEWGGPYIREKAAGLVVAASGGRPGQDAFFHICTRDHPGRRFACAFGEVCAGMEVVHQAVALQPSHDLKVSDCGLVLPRLQC